MTKAKDADYWRGVIERLRLDHGNAVAAERDAAQAAAGEALAASLGDRQATVRLALADERQAAAGRRVRQLSAALADAEQQLRAVREAEARAEVAARLEVARRVAGEIIRVDGEIDTAMRTMAAAFEVREDLMRDLGRVGQLDNARVNKLRNRTMRLAAVHAAGLGQFLPVSRVPPHHWTNLAAWDARFLGALLPPVADQPPAPAPPPPPPTPSPPSGPELSEADWERLEEREARRSFA
jgi:hypothetical protein